MSENRGNLRLSAERFLAALRRIRGFVADGEPLDAADDTTPGDKSTTCSWGLCRDDRKAWPDREDHLFSHRSSPKYRAKGQHCPLDSDQGERTSPGGCFWRCRVFQGATEPGREETIRLYDIAIANREVQP